MVFNIAMRIGLSCFFLCNFICSFVSLSAVECPVSGPGCITELKIGDESRNVAGYGNAVAMVVLHFYTHVRARMELNAQ